MGIIVGTSIILILLRPLLQLQPDSWLLSRLSPHTNPRPPTNPTEAETDSGLDSLNEDSEKLQENREKLIGEDEMQVRQRGF